MCTNMMHEHLLYRPDAVTSSVMQQTYLPVNGMKRKRTKSTSETKAKLRLFVIYHISRLGFLPCLQARCHYPASVLLIVGPSGLQDPQGELELELKDIFNLHVTLMSQA